MHPDEKDFDPEPYLPERPSEMRYQRFRVPVPPRQPVFSFMSDASFASPGLLFHVMEFESKLQKSPGGALYWAWVRV